MNGWQARLRRSEAPSINICLPLHSNFHSNLSTAGVETDAFRAKHFGNPVALRFASDAGGRGRLSSGRPSQNAPAAPRLRSCGFGAEQPPEEREKQYGFVGRS